MNTKKVIQGFFILILTIGLFSCKKEVVESTTTPNRPTSMADLSSAPDFSWQTVRNVKVILNGSHTMSTNIKSADGEVYFNGMVKPNAGIETTIALPATLNEVIVNYGPFSKTVEIINNTIDCTFNLNSY